MQKKNNLVFWPKFHNPFSCAGEELEKSGRVLFRCCWLLLVLLLPDTALSPSSFPGLLFEFLLLLIVVLWLCYLISISLSRILAASRYFQVRVLSYLASFIVFSRVIVCSALFFCFVIVVAFPTQSVKLCDQKVTFSMSKVDKNTTSQIKSRNLFFNLLYKIFFHLPIPILLLKLRFNA